MGSVIKFILKWYARVLMRPIYVDAILRRREMIIINSMRRDQGIEIITKDLNTFNLINHVTVYISQ